LFYQALIHNAPEYPDVGERGILISPGFETSISVYPSSCGSDSEFDLLPAEDRECYLDSENILQYYSSYTVSRCLKECLTNKILEQCSCRPFIYAGIVKL